MVLVYKTALVLRLPIIQGGTFAFLAPAFALLSQDNLKCPTEGDKIFNVTSRTWSSNVNYTEKTEEWQVRMRALQGAIIVSSISQLLLGLTGIKTLKNKKIVF